MGKMKFYDLAKELNIPSKELLEKAKTIGIEIKSYLSNIEDEDSKKIRERFGVKSKKMQKKNCRCGAIFKFCL